MATFVLFDQARIDLLSGVHNLGSGGDTIKVGFISSSTTPSQATAAPHWNGTGTTDLSTNEVSGGDISAGGKTLANKTVSGDPNTLWNADDVSIASNGSNPSNVRSLVYYNDTDTNKRAIGYVTYTTDQDLSSGSNTIDHTNGIFQISGN